MSTSAALRQIFTAGRPLVEQWLDVAEQIAGLRNVATAAGLDWSQVKALLKAQIQDERDDDGEGKRVSRIIEKAEFASAYADMLGLGNMNENNFSDQKSRTEEPVRIDGSCGGDAGTLSGIVTSFDGHEGDASPVAITPSSAPTSSPDATKTETVVAPLAAVSVTIPDEEVPAFLKPAPKPLRPNCLHPENCGGYGTKTCHSCTVAARESEAA